MRLKYGFICNYAEIISLRQVFVNGEWELQYSPVVRREVVGKQQTPSNPNVSVSVREGLFHMAVMFSHGHEADNQSQWVISPVPAYQTSTSMVSTAPTGLVLMAQASQLKSERATVAIDKLSEKRRLSIAERYYYTFRNNVRIIKIKN